jgi:hypothetical protein
VGTYTKYLNTIQTGGTNVVTSGGSKSYANIISSYQKPKATPTPTTYASPTPTVTLNKPKVLNTVGNFLKTSAEKISKTKPTDYIMGAGQDVVSKSLRQYVSDSFKATSEVVKSLYKITPIYEISQNIKGEKVTPKENLKNSIDLALNTISAIYRISPAAPVIGAVSGSLKESRQESQRVISILASKEDKRVKATKLLNLPTDASDEQIADATKNYKRNYTGRLLNAAISGVTEQPGVGAVITDNPVAQSIIDVAFMAIMISRPFIKKKLNKLNLKANELAKVSETLEVKPNASMEEISISYKNKVTQYKDVFAGRGTPEQIAQVQKLNDSYNILKKTNVFERVYAGLFGKVNPSDFNVLNEAPLAIREKAGLSTDVKVPTTPEIVKTTPSGEVIKAGEVVKKAEVPSKGYFRYANDVNKTTDNVRGGTWFTNKEGSGVIKDAMNPKNVSEVAIGGDKIFSFSGEPRNPLIVEDVGLLEEGSFAVINNGYENFMQKKYSNAANSLYNKTLNAEKSPSSQEVDKIITDTLSTTGFSTEQIKNVLTLTGKNKLDSAFDLIISTGLKNEGYDSIILKQGNLEHMMYFGKSDVKDLSTQPIKTGEVKPLFDKWVKDYDSGSLKKALEIVEQNPKLREESIKNLPNRMTVYKAIQEGSDTPSWTLDKGLAERWAENGGRELESMKISKSDVGYYLGGPESELFLKNASKEIFDIQPLKTGGVSTPEVKGVIPEGKGKIYYRGVRKVDSDKWGEDALAGATTLGESHWTTDLEIARRYAGKDGKVYQVPSNEVKTLYTRNERLPGEGQKVYENPVIKWEGKTPNMKEVSPSIPSVKTGGDDLLSPKSEGKPFDYQNNNQEVIIRGRGVGGEWKNGNSYRYKLENAGDIFRETTKSSPDDGYIREKVTKLDALLTKIENNKLHPDDSLEYSSNENPGKFAELKKLWQQQPVTSPEQQIAKDLNLALIDGDFTKARTLLNQIQSPPIKTGEVKIDPSKVVYKEFVPDTEAFTGYVERTGLDKQGLTDSAVDYLQTWTNIEVMDNAERIGAPPEDVVKTLSKFKPDKPITLYRGVQSGGSVEDAMSIKTGYESWTTSINNAKNYAKKDGKVLTREFSPNDILVDYSKLPKDYFDINGNVENEVIVKVQPTTNTEIKKRPIAEVKEELSATKTTIEETKAKSKAVAEFAQVARAEINTKDVALLKRIYFKSQKFQEGDIETIRNSNTGKLLNNVIENVQEKFPNMSEQEAFDYAMQLPTKASEIPKRSPEIKELSQKLKAIETEYQDYVEKNKLGIGVRKKAIENGIRISMKDLPEYEKVSVDDQAEQALKILVTDPAYALDIALGKVEPPPGLLPESMFNAVEVDALARGDAETLLQLATQSSLVSDATVMGQRLRMLAERNPDSPVSMMKDVIKEKQKALEKKTGKSTSENVKEETAKLKESIDKAKPDKMDWRAFIESIKCK